MMIEEPKGDDLRQDTRSKHTGSGYFWQSNDGGWETDVRKICDPRRLSALVAERDARVRLIGIVKAVGPAAVVDYARVIPETPVTVVSQDGLSRTVNFDSDYITDLLNRHRCNFFDPVRYTLPEIIDSLLRDEAVAKLQKDH